MEGSLRCNFAALVKTSKCDCLFLGKVAFALLVLLLVADNSRNTALGASVLR